MRYAFFASDWLLIALAWSVGQLGFLPLSRAAAGETTDPVASALVAALARNAEHARNWLAEKDFKSLAQSASGLEMLTELTRARSDDEAWQAAAAKLIAAAKEAASAAKSEDAAAAGKSIQQFAATCDALQKVTPQGKPLAPPRGTAIRPLMLLLDSAYADAKISVLTGNAAAAKKQAYVLSELGRVVSNSASPRRGSERWPELSGAFIEASLTAARSSAEDTATVRQLLRGISQRCEACHETR